MKQLNRTEKYQQMRRLLNEKQWRQYLALEAQECGSMRQVAQAAQVAYNTVQRGVREVEAGESFVPGGRQRKPGGGRKPAMMKDTTLLTTLESQLDPKGDPMSLLKWTTKSVAHLKEALQQLGHPVAETTIRRLLHHLGYSLKANKKNIEGRSHPDRDAQFLHITRVCQRFVAHGAPIISVDCKKKELLGRFKNPGATWQAKGEQTDVNVYDFRSLADGKAIPYGIYDLVHNRGFVNVGIDHETAEFAVESIRRWWKHQGKQLYPGKKTLLITADGGGSNGVRCRLWKHQLQVLANEEQLAITVAHYPPATSKWNTIEHRLFSFISINWRAEPLLSMEVVLELISHTTTDQGLTVTAVKDSNTYPTGRVVSEEEFATLHLFKAPFHGEWNYTILPQPSLAIHEVI